MADSPFSRVALLFESARTSIKQEQTTHGDPTRSGQKKTNPHKVRVFSEAVSTGGNPHTTPKPGVLSDGIIIITASKGQ